MTGKYADLKTDDIQFPDDFVKCELSNCFCARDVVATKYLNK